MRGKQPSDDNFGRECVAIFNGGHFQGEATVGPKSTSSPASMLKLVTGLPSALGALYVDDVPAGDVGFKVLRVDGKAPNEAGYLLVP